MRVYTVTVLCLSWLQYSMPYNVREVILCILEDNKLSISCLSELFLQLEVSTFNLSKYMLTRRKKYKSLVSTTSTCACFPRRFKEIFFL